MNRAAALLGATLIATSAHAAERAVIPQEFVQKTNTRFFIPSLQREATAEVGETLYREGIRTVSKRFRIALKEAVTTPLDTKYTFSTKAGHEGPLLKRPGSPIVYLCAPATGSGFLGIGTKVVTGCLADSTGSGAFDRVAFAHTTAVYPLAAPVPYEVETFDTVTVDQDKFHIDVLYQGMSKGEVKVSYREFINDMARPAFDQDVSYELDADGTAVIAFKGMRIKVLKATGQNIRYILEQPLPLRAGLASESPSDRTPSTPWYQ